MKSTLIKTIAIAATLTFLSCSDSNHQKAQEAEPIAVTTNQITTNTANQLSVSGVIQAVNNATLSTRIMGHVNRVHVNIGDKVSQGQLLVSINNTDLQARRAQVNASINEAQVAVNNAQRDSERFNALFAQNSATQKEVDDMLANYQMAQARLASAQAMKAEVEAQFAYAEIRAPFSGVVTNRFVEAGTMATPGMPLIAIEAPGSFEVRATVPERTIGQINTGDKVSININAINKTIEGTLSQVSASATTSGGQFPIKVALNESNNLKSGMFATVIFSVEQTEDQPQIITVPKQAIITQGDLRGVYTVSQQNTAMLRWLRLGRSFGDQVEVLSGLSPQEAVIVSAEGKLFNGAKVEVKP